jgi:hypothetical protein
MAPGRVSFVIVGSPRSGTTLVQRLATELPGVAVPFETHFFTKGIVVLAEAGAFPLSGAALTDALTRYAALPALRDADLDVAAVVERLGGTAAGALAVFDAVVAVAAGPHTTLGEKTPGHVSWLARLRDLRPDLLVVGVVRDPRAVVASRRAVAWGGSSVYVLATRWLDAQRHLAEHAAACPDRTIVLRYEDVVSDPDRARRSIADLVGAVPDAERPVAPAARFGLPWEDWKQRASEPITDDRTEQWREELSGDQVARIGAICAPMLDRFGYSAARTTRATPWFGRRAARARRDRRRAEEAIRREREVIAHADLGAPEAHAGAERTGSDGPG